MHHTSFSYTTPPRKSIRLSAPEANEACESGASGCVSPRLGGGTCTSIANMIASKQVDGKALPAKSWYCRSLVLAAVLAKSSTGNP